MKKLILLSILIISVAAAAIPQIIGAKVEDTFRIEHEEAAKDASLSGVDIELIDYQRSYLDATATTRISFAFPDSKDIKKQQTISFDMLHKISHMPQIDEQVIASVDSELILSDEINTKLDQLFKGQSPLVIKTRIFFDGHQDGTINSPDAKGQIGGDNKDIAIDWQGINGSLWQSAERDNITFNVNLPGITMSPIKAQAITPDGENNDTMSFHELSYSGKMQRSTNGMWLGDFEGRIASIALDVKKEETPFSMLINKIGIKGNQSESNGLINGGGAITAKSININGFMLSNAVYDIAIENIDADAVVAWQKTAGKLMQGKVDPVKGLEPLAKYIPALFNAHPAIHIKNLSVDSPMGHIAFKLNTRVTGKWDDLMLQNPTLIVPLLKIDLDADLPKAIVVSGLKKQIRSAMMQQATLSGTEIDAEKIEATVNQVVEQQLSGIITQGFIKENETQLQSHIVFDAGKLTVNGVDASQMIGAMMHQGKAQ